MRYFFAIFGFIVVVTISLLGIRGSRFIEPPIEVFPDMDRQARYKPQGSNDFFADGRNDRPVVAGTVPRGSGPEIATVFSADYVYDRAAQPQLYTGKDEDGELLAKLPVAVTNELMQLGREKYTIFCQVCHGAVGDGNGITKSYGMVATPTFHDERIRTMPDGEIFQTITHGKGQMGAYNYALRPEERWAVIAYLRALQLAGNATIEDVPLEFRSQLGL